MSKFISNLGLILPIQPPAAAASNAPVGMEWTVESAPQASRPHSRGFEQFILAPQAITAPSNAPVGLEWLVESAPQATRPCIRGSADLFLAPRDSPTAPVGMGWYSDFPPPPPKRKPGSQWFVLAPQPITAPSNAPVGMEWRVENQFSAPRRRTILSQAPQLLVDVSAVSPTTVGPCAIAADWHMLQGTATDWHLTQGYADDMHLCPE